MSQERAPDRVAFSSLDPRVKEYTLTKDQYDAMRAVTDAVYTASAPTDTPLVQSQPVEISSTSSDAWQKRRNCKNADPEIFFPARGKSAEPAKEICRACVVLEPCREKVLTKENNDKGIVAGMTEQDRRKIRSARLKAKKAS